MNRSILAKPPLFPPFNTRVVLLLYRLIWAVCLPLIMFYLYRRGKKEPAYFKFLSERFGHHKPRDERHIWIHAVSLGEVRSAVPLIERLLQDDTPVVTTHFTPAGRSEAVRLFPGAVADGRLTACYVPFDYGVAFARFFKAFRPVYGLVMEVEFWPGMIMSSRKCGVPLYLCNGQYPSRSFQRDQKRFFSRAKIVPGFAGVMVKSELQAARFRALGIDRVAITGEMRFEQPIPQAHITAARTLKNTEFGARPVITMASMVVGEDTGALDMIAKVQSHFLQRGLDKPLFIYVPRAPERFDVVAGMISEKSFSYVKRSDVLDAHLRIKPRSETTAAENAKFDISGVDIVLGDSLGEMYFYLELCDLAIVGGGFSPKGSHNISEPLCLRKPVIIGPNDYTIEFPAREAMAHGVCLQMDFSQITEQLITHSLQFASNQQMGRFLDVHSGGTAKTIAALDDFMYPTSR